MNVLSNQLIIITHHRRNGVGYNFTCVCLQYDNFESLGIGSSLLHIQYISREYGLSSYMKVIRSRSRSKNVENPYSCSVLTLSLGSSDLYRPLSSYCTPLNTCIRGWSAVDQKAVLLSLSSSSLLLLKMHRLERCCCEYAGGGDLMQSK